MSPQPRKYKSNAERQAAYRERQKKRLKRHVSGEPHGPLRPSTPPSDLSDYRGPDPK